jgi:sugar phosphate permease
LLIAFGAGGCVVVATSTAVANWFEKKVGMALAVMGCGFGAGGLMVPLIVRLIDIYGWRITLLIFGSGMWVMGIPLSLIIRNRPEQYGYHPDGKVSRPPITDFEMQGKRVEISLKEALKKRSFLYLNMAEAIRTITVVAVITHAMPYLSSVGIPRSTAGLVTGAIALLSIIGRFGFGWVADVFDKRQVMAFAFFFVGLGTLAFCYVHMRLFVFLFLILFSSGLGGIMILRGAFIREYFGQDSFGKLLGITMGSSSLGGIIGPTLAGWTFDTMGAYNFFWIVCCGIMGVAIVLILSINGHEMNKYL